MDGPPLQSITGVNRSADEDTWTPLHRSAFTGDHETVVELLRQGSSVSELSSNGRTPLMLASLQGHDSVVSALLAHTTDVDIDVKDNEGRTALYHATDNVHASIVELLIECGAGVNTVDVQGIAPLHTAIANNSLELVRCFLNAEANVNITDPKDGFVGLHIAAQEGFCDIMELLLDHADTDINVQNVNGFTPLHGAAYCNRPDAVKMLLQRGADVRKTTDDGHTPIISAVMNNSVDSLSVLLNHGHSDIDAKCRFNGATALAIAAYMGYSAIVEKLIAYGANVDAIDDDCRTPLHYLVDHKPGEKKSTDSDHFKVAELLIKSGGATENFTAYMDTVDVQGFTPLQTGIANNSLELVRCFLNAGTKVNVANPKTGFVGLHIAAQEGFCDIMELLLDQSDTDINVQNVHGYTPLHSAAYYNRPDAVNMLLQKGADACKTTDEGYTPIICASVNNSIDSLSVLLNHDNSDIEAKCSLNGCYYGATALATAAYMGYSAVVEKLIAYGANVDVIDEYGRTPLHYVVHHNPGEKKSTDSDHFKVAELLIKSGRANVNALNFTAYMDTVDVQGFTPLHTAIASNSLELVRWFLNAGAKVNIADPKTGFVALHTAAHEGFCDIMEQLLDHADTEINVQDVSGNTPLHIAAYYNRPDAVNMLLQRGADVRKTTYDGYTPIISASLRNNNIDSLSVLLNHDNSDIDAKCPSTGATALATASSRGYSAVVEKLIAYGANVDAIDEYGRTPLHYVVNHNPGEKKSKDSDHFKVAELLRKSGRANVNALNFSAETPLHYIALNTPGNLQIMKLLLDSGADINAQNSVGSTPLHCAMVRVRESALYKNAVYVLVQRGADLYRVDCGELRSSIHHWKLLLSRHRIPPKLVAQYVGAFEIRIIRESNQPIDYLNNTRLHLAVGLRAFTGCGRTGSMVDFQLRTGGDLTVQNIFGETPLHLTTAANLKRILESETFKAEFFLVKDKSGRTPLHTYCCEPKFNITNKHSLQQLAKRIKPNDKIQLRDLVNTPDDFGRTPLHYAAEIGHIGKLRYFLEGGSDCNVRDIQGRIPLHYAKTRFVYNLLLAWTKNECIRDVDGLEPNEMMQMRQTDEDCSQRMKDLRAERFGKLQKYLKNL